MSLSLYRRQSRVPGKCAGGHQPDAQTYVVGASEVVISPHAKGAGYLAVYRQWMELAPISAEVAAPRRGEPRPGTAAATPDPHDRAELIVLSVKQTAARGRLLGSDQIVTLRAGRLWQ